MNPNYRKYVPSSMIRLILCVAFMMISVASFSADVLNTNLVTNPSFTGGDPSWSWSLSNGVTWDSDTGFAKRGSLKFVASTTPRWAATRYFPPCYAGRMMAVSAWVRNSLPTDTSLGTCVEVVCYTSDGKKIGYRDSQAIGTDGNWKKVTLNVRIPYNASTVKIVLINKSTSANAWIDDVDCRYIDTVSFRSLIKFPGYRDTLYSNDERKITAGVESYSSISYPIEYQQVQLDLIDSDKRIFSTAKNSAGGPEGWASISCVVPPGISGSISARVRLVDSRDGTVIMEKSHLVVISTAALPKVYFDKYNRWIVDGQPFFPIGVYTSKTSLDDLDKLQASGFNTIMDYAILSYYTPGLQRELFDALQARDMKIIFSLKDVFNPINGEWSVTSWGDWTGVNNVVTGLVNAHKNDEAIIGWYTNDERSEGYLDQIGATYSLIKQLDPDHPCVQTLWGQQDFPTQVSLADLTALDQYVVWFKYRDNLRYVDFSLFGSQAKVIYRSGMASRPIMVTTECGRFPETSTSLPPTVQEMLCLSYISIINGGRGVLFYSLPNLQLDGSTQWDALGVVGRNLGAIRDIVLGIDSPIENQVTSSDDNVQCLTRDVNGITYVLAVNPSPTSITTKFNLPSGLDAAYIDVGLPGDVASRQQVIAGAFNDTIEAAGTRVYCVVK